MRDKELLIMFLITIVIFSITILRLGLQVNLQNRYIKQLEQSLAEQIQEVEVYRGILEQYQTEGIINE